MTDQSLEHDPLGELAEEFLGRLRQGERPSVSEYAARYPELAERIQNVFPTLAMVEDLGRDLPGDAALPDKPVAGVPVIPPQVGDYRLIREIGRGGMGIVFEAEQVSLKRSVALKILFSRDGGRSDSWARFQREARVTARLHHTNIVSAFDVGEDNGVCFLAMQFIEGRPLNDVIEELRRLQRNGLEPEAADRSRGPAAQIAQSICSGQIPHGPTPNEPSMTDRLPTAPNTSSEQPLAGLDSVATESTVRIEAANRTRYFVNVARLTQQAAEALDFAHLAGVVHRDVKPSNLLLDVDGRLWVTDFGLAKEDEAAVTQTGDVLGTLRYMAPEQFRGQPERRSDLYALGATMYELLTLRPAFAASERGQFVRQILDEQPRSPRSFDDGIPRDLETICLKLLEKDSHRRYSSAREVAEELGRFLRHEPIRARPLSIVGRFARWCHRNPVVASLSCALFMALLVGLIGVATQWKRAEHNWSRAEASATRATKASRRASLEADRANEEAHRARNAAADAEFARDRLRETAYVAHLNLTQQAWHSTNVTRVVELLEQQVPRDSAIDLRGFEWHYWWRQAHRFSGELSFDGRAVRSFAIIEAPSERDGSTSGEATVFLPEGCRLAVALDGEPPTVLLCDVDGTDGRLKHRVIAELSGHSAPVSVVRVSPDQSLIATGSFDRSVRLWDAASGSLLKTLSSHSSDVRDVAFSPDGRRLVSVSGDSQSFGEVRLWSVPEGDLLDSPPTPNTSPMHSVAFLDDLRIAIGVQQVGQIYVYEGSPLQRSTRLLGHERTTTALQVSADGKRLASASWDGSVRLWNAEMLAEIRKLAGHTAEVETVVFHPDGRLLASAGRDQTIRLWDSENGQSLSLLKCCDVLSTLRFSRSGDRLLAGCRDGTIRWWNVADLLRDQPLTAHQQSCVNVTVSSDGRMLATSGRDNVIQIWDVTSRRLLQTLRGHTRVPWKTVFDPTGRTLISCGNGELRRWNLETGELQQTARVTAQVLYTLAASPDGRLLATAGRNQVLWLHDGESFDKMCQCQGHTAVIRDVAFSSDGSRLVTAADDGSIRLWSSDGEPLRVLTTPNSKFVGTRLTPDGQRVLAGSDDGRLHAWNAETGEPLSLIRGGHRDLTSLTLSPDGTRLATASRDRTVKLWDLRTGEPVLTLDAHQTPVTALTFDPAGRTLITADESGIVRRWDATAVSPLRDRIPRPKAAP